MIVHLPGRSGRTRCGRPITCCTVATSESEATCKTCKRLSAGRGGETLVIRGLTRETIAAFKGYMISHGYHTQAEALAGLLEHVLETALENVRLTARLDVVEAEKRRAEAERDEALRLHGESLEDQFEHTVRPSPREE